MEPLAPRQPLQYSPNPAPPIDGLDPVRNATIAQLAQGVTKPTPAAIGGFDLRSLLQQMAQPTSILQAMGIQR